MLRKLRTTFAVIFFVLLTLTFLDFTGTLHHWFGWIAKIQFLPALLALNIAVVAGLLLLTFLFGRIYCSVICPLGVFQDVISRIARRFKKNRFTYSPALHWLRYGVLVLFVLAFIFGVNGLYVQVEPYSAYGRMVSGLLAPVYQQGNNLLAHIAERWNTYTFYPVEVWIKSGIMLAVAAVSFIVVAVLAWRGGRTYCNTVCPVGTVLGFLSKYAIYKPVINTGKCNSCGLCARNCKASCIDSKTHRIDYSRCVTCMDCVEKCKQDAIQYRPSLKGAPAAVESKVVVNQSIGDSDTVRRTFLSVATLFAVSATLKARQKQVEGGLAVIEDKKIPNRATPLAPAGSQSIFNLAKHCTACQLCISACPNEVLRPSGKLTSLMQPEMSYERGYCRPECVRCSEVCPTGAIHKITTAEKSAIQIGHAVWIRKNCVVIADNVKCGNCARHCPVNAIQMVPLDAKNPRSPQIPVVNTERCIGCGACENLCPARPFSAIYVEGHERHRLV